MEKEMVFKTDEIMEMVNYLAPIIATREMEKRKEKVKIKKVVAKQVYNNKGDDKYHNIFVTFETD